ncbi:hypothetical protein [Streptomyces sp. NPDC048521]|uniref:hypothetical protein n=1 Tax=Streptomyces sp. NPDC048521 TaxID=3365566 RepID=UPI003713B634
MPITVNVTAAASAREIGAQVAATIRHARPKPAHHYPRPPVTVLHGDLFREPVYEDGQAYADPDDADDGEGA